MKTYILDTVSLKDKLKTLKSRQKSKILIMKKVKFEGKLSLNKETISKLNETQMGNVKGGATDSQGSYCCGYTRSDYCCVFSFNTQTACATNK